MSKGTSYRVGASSAEKNGVTDTVAAATGATVATGSVTAANVTATGANAAAHAEGVALSDIKVLASHFGAYRADFIKSGLCVFAESVLELFIPFLMARIVDEGIMHGNLQTVFVNGIAMVAFALLAMGAGIGYARFSARAAMGLGARLREDEFACMQGFAFANLDRFDSSSLVTRLTSDVTIIQNAIAMGTRPFMRGPIMLIMGVFLACVMSPELAFVYFAVLPFLALCLFFIVTRVSPLYQALQGSMDKINEVLQEDFAAIRAIKAYVREGFVSDRFATVNAAYAKTATRTFGTSVMNVPAFQAAMYVANVAILLFGGRMIMAGTLGVGELTGFMSYVLLIMNSLMMISGVFLLTARAITSVHRIGEILSEIPAIKSPQDGLTKAPDGSIAFKDVSFKYSFDAKEDVLEDITLSFTSGSTIGILGGTGSGKTTLVQLIARLYDATTGTVEVGGHDVRAYDLASLRDAVAVVLQKNVLFSGTVRDNLCWGNPQATDEELLEVCRIACVDEFLDRIGGLDGDLGQGGVNVSGGQKQRLCIARALLKHPQVLIFDDSTSAVDTATDAKIRSGLARLKGTTKIIIAQRVNSVMEADQIVVLDNGRVHMTGTHAELLVQSPIYRELYESQMHGSDLKSHDSAQDLVSGEKNGVLSASAIAEEEVHHG